MKKTIGIMGAGPAGLVLAKEALEHGITPVIFEQHSDLGGIWNPKTGKTWDGMRTNLTHHHMGFSDHAWPEATPDYPRNTTVFNYLKDYAAAFRLERYIQYEQKVHNTSFKNGLWHITAGNDTTPQSFDFMGYASGIFNKPCIPKIAGMESFDGEIVHGVDYKKPSDFRGKNVAVVGGSFSGYEICADLAEAGIPVTHILRKNAWVIPRYVPLKKGAMPLDLTSYQHNRVTDYVNATDEDKNTARIGYFNHNFGNPGDINKELRVSIDPTQPLYMAISDNYLKHVKAELITPYCHEVEKMTHEAIVLKTTRHIDADVVIFCTGYESDLAGDDSVKRTLSYQENDLFQPLLLNRATMHHQLQGATFVGMYRGPFFGVMEMQARWGMGIASGQIEEPHPFSSRRGLWHEAELRKARPRQQFPRANYVEFMHNLAEKIGVVPEDLLDQARNNIPTPMIPADFRRTGIGANPKMAEQQRKHMLQRLAE